MAGDPHIKNKPFYLAVRVNLLICARSPIFYTTYCYNNSGHLIIQLTAFHYLTFY